MYTENEKALIWLDLFEFISYKHKEQLMALTENEPSLLFDFEKYKSTFAKAFKPSEISKIELSLKQKHLENQLAMLEKNNVLFVSIFSKEYPEKLKNIQCPPFGIYCKGDVSLLNQQSLAIVGTRKPTKYGERITQKLTKDLVKSNFVIVAGMAEGVDSVAHKTALESGGKTIAVLGGGFNAIYPKSNIALFNKIAEQGLVVSEYKPSDLPVLFHFPIRNRIIVGLSDGVLITEAGLKSGTNYTRDYAIEENRQLFAVPGNIDSEMSEGTNKLIRQFPETMVLSVDNILDKFGKKHIKEQKKEKIQLSLTDQEILKYLSLDEEIHFDQLLSLTKQLPQNLNNCLTTLALRGIICKYPGNYYGLKG